ncbi:hypothetical protein QO011_000506 [Labrys wisconsinensis]|uniref:Uncharacterized protein n=1 Tax=Labrys wisconsinensis TaxID=425677 RepID=A0ABU0IZR5_9HYPH|nr:hypothetical protein [Labrys wisconsinensis]MDQ0467511.1 hypothetical protein [Labrys wisconsinensis]
MAAADEIADQRPRNAHGPGNVLLGDAVEPVQPEGVADPVRQVPQRPFDQAERLASLQPGRRTGTGSFPTRRVRIRGEEPGLEGDPAGAVDRDVAHGAHDIALGGVDLGRRPAVEEAEHGVLHHVLGQGAAPDLPPGQGHQGRPHRLRRRQELVCPQFVCLHVGSDPLVESGMDMASPTAIRKYFSKYT